MNDLDYEIKADIETERDELHLSMVEKPFPFW